MESIKTILEKNRHLSLISPWSSSSSKERKLEEICPKCGNPLKVVFMEDPVYLKTTGNKPHWAKLPCEVCELNQVVTEIEERIEMSSFESLLKNSMLDRRFIGKTFENFLLYGPHQEKQRDILFYTRDFAKHFARHREQGTWLLFAGNTGTGKGHLCAAIINQITASGYSALFTKTPRLLREIKETFNRDSEVTQGEILKRIRELDLLVIDEIGVQFGTDTERMILYEILDLRYEAMLPVILTTNIQNMKTLEKLLGERIIDRLFEGQSKIIIFDWESHRRFMRGKTDESG